MTANKEEFLARFQNFITANYRVGGIPVSTLGQVWKKLEPDIDWPALGFQRMSDALFAITDTADSEWELMNRGTPHMLLFKKGDNLEKDIDSTDGTAATSVTKCWSPRLTQAVWLAFVNDIKWGKRYINRETGDIRETSQHTGDNWVEIEPISQDQQRKWATDFLAEMNLADRTNLTDALSQDPWYLHFSRILALTPPYHAAWNAYKSRNVYEYVEKWCIQNNLDVHILRESNKTNERKLANGVTSPAKSNVRLGSQSELRRILIGAFSNLHTHEMLDVRLPSHALITALRPDLLE